MSSGPEPGRQLIRLDSADDPRVADYTRLSDSRLRRTIEPHRGLYIAESSRVLRRALAAGHRPRSFFLAERWLDNHSLDDVFAAHPQVPIFVGPDELLEEIAGFHLHRGALAAMNRPALANYRDLLAGARRIAILDSLVDHTNVGACFRSAAAMGVDAVLVTPRCADPLYRRAIRVSMGTVFQVPWTRIDPWPSGVDQLKAAGYVVAGMTLGDGAITLDELVAEDHQKLALVFGTEGNGLGPLRRRCLIAR